MKKTSTKLTAFSVFILFGALITGPSAFAKSYAKAFQVSYDKVWKSTLIAVTKYPLEKNDKASGEISTSSLESGEVFQNYQQAPKINEFYTLHISLEKRMLKGKGVTLVTIEKKPLIKGDFMRKDRSLESDGVEESVLLYRIKREISIDRVIGKLFK